jgi:hypothetical protein
VPKQRLLVPVEHTTTGSLLLTNLVIDFIIQQAWLEA